MTTASYKIPLRETGSHVHHTSKYLSSIEVPDLESFDPWNQEFNEIDGRRYHVAPHDERVFTPDVPESLLGYGIVVCKLPNPETTVTKYITENLSRKACFDPGSTMAVSLSQSISKILHRTEETDLVLATFVAVVSRRLDLIHETYLGLTRIMSGSLPKDVIRRICRYLGVVSFPLRGGRGWTYPFQRENFLKDHFDNFEVFDLRGLDPKKDCVELYLPLIVLIYLHPSTSPLLCWTPGLLFYRPEDIKDIDEFWEPQHEERPFVQKEYKKLMLVDSGGSMSVETDYRDGPGTSCGPDLFGELGGSWILMGQGKVQLPLSAVANGTVFFLRDRFYVGRGVHLEYRLFGQETKAKILNLPYPVGYNPRGEDIWIVAEKVPSRGGIQNELVFRYATTKVNEVHFYPRIPRKDLIRNWADIISPPGSVPGRHTAICLRTLVELSRRTLSIPNFPAIKRLDGFRVTEMKAPVYNYERYLIDTHLGLKNVLKECARGRVWVMDIPGSPSVPTYLERFILDEIRGKHPWILSACSCCEKPTRFKRAAVQGESMLSSFPSVNLAREAINTWSRNSDYIQSRRRMTMDTHFTSLA